MKEGDVMPAFVGPLQIFRVDNGIVHFGDTAFISPKTNSRASNGSSANTTANWTFANNFISVNTVFDNKLIDQPTIGNN